MITLDAAFELAARVGANVAGCHVRPERHESRAKDPGLFSGIFSEPRAKPRTENALTRAAARKAFASSAQKHEFKLAKAARIGRTRCAYWRELVGSPERMFAIAGTIADLAILSRPKPNSSGTAREFLLAAVLCSGRPVLVMPQRHLASIGKRIIVAWNQSADAALAVSAAMPLLQRAERVTVVTCGTENRTGPKSRHLAQYLANWDVKIDVVHTKGANVEHEIEEAYAQTKSDLLVMGAYSRSRLRELIFGGVTEHMLLRAKIPVFLWHR